MKQNSGTEIFQFLFLCFILTETSHGLPGWLRIWNTASSLGIIDRVNECDMLPGLINKQVRICKDNLEVMDSVREGATKAIEECQYQFHNRRWNCSKVQTKAVIAGIENEGTREAAFVHAISSAGVSHTVTSACSTGELDTCGCDRTITGSGNGDLGEFTWSGCSDNIAYGTMFSKSFVDAREKRKKGLVTSSKQLVNLHNNAVGRKIIAENMERECKCHGVSGSCEMRTCWWSMPSFRIIGLKLKSKFDSATEVEQVREGSRRKLVRVNKNFKPHTSSDLVYVKGSPDFCQEDPKSGSLGTRGRECNVTSKALDGCELMCCGRGFQSRTEVVEERCSCKFHWCCYVSCKQCKRTVEIHTCK